MNNRLYGQLIFELSKPGRKGYSLPANAFEHHELSPEMKRGADATLPECDELTVVRHYTNHSANNFGVNNGFYPLGSCTMKYNPVIDEETAALPAFTALHPLQPESTCQGALEVYYRLQQSLAAIAGMEAFTLNPFAGAHGELTGLMVIRDYHLERGDKKRVKVIVPDSAHGTNPASAAVCGLEVVEVKSRADGCVDVDDLRALLDDSVAAMMMTNPNTLGLFERDIPEIAKLVHECGGLMYYDGANLNPLLGVCRPGDMGFDVMHINLHKTFATPHGGGGPGSGPVGVRKGLEHLLPSPRVTFDGERYHLVRDKEAISVGAFLGNFGVIVRAYTYILSLGRENLRMVGPLATLNANYIKESLKDLFELPIDGLCKHEFVFDGLKDKSTGVTTMDVAKRLLDYGYHAPTIYFPLLFHESLMIEPTESENLDTIDGFIDVMRRIAEEAATQPELVKNAPHNTPIGRVDDVKAARQPILTYKKMKG
ncbi:MAG: aminomethyl-transferring glycine dehydrogenase subunit GcvPB [Prevotella sp.]|nr:aminomethyl-transferring glycine dehydrogenase subunit GcvPB [Prevotella sp.]MBR7054786.1 aminomethyl-transferring glycine dehydrogenase subunit GcvPB [Prevotella sp.]